MIRKINTANFNSINFKAKKKTQEKEEKNAPKRVRRNYTRLEDSYNPIERFCYYTFVKKNNINSKEAKDELEALKAELSACTKKNEFIANCSKAYSDIPAKNRSAKSSFKYFKNFLNYCHEQALEFGNERIVKNGIEVMVKYDDKLKPIYAVATDYNDDYILDFDNEIVMKNYRVDPKTKLASIDEVYIYNCNKSGNIYSNIANSSKCGVNLINVAEKSKNSISADYAMLYHTTRQDELNLCDTFIDSDIVYFKTNNSTIINAKERTVNDINGNVCKYFSSNKVCFQNGIMTASKNHKGKVIQMYGSNSRPSNYGLLDSPEDIAESYIKIFD